MESEIVSYGKSDSELTAEKSVQCREIVARIVEFGVSQEQIEKIISLLSLELENREDILAISEIFNKKNDAKTKKEVKIIYND
jgi:hypothetical protein